jgi:hypothetical protein
MNTVLLLGGLAFLVLTGVWSPARAHKESALSPPAGVCLAASTDTLNYQESLLRLMTRTDSITTAERANLGLQLTTPANVTIIKTESKCSRAAFVIDSLLATPNSGRKVLMFKLGTSFGAESPTFTASQGVAVVFLFNGQMDYSKRISLGGS